MVSTHWTMQCATTVDLKETLRPSASSRASKKKVSRLEASECEPPIDTFNDLRAGLNLTYRTLASALKYDHLIPHVRSGDDPFVKGYYAEEADYIERIKQAVEPKWKERKSDFKTLECSIMDVADDIAYSTYDLEDSFKAGFLTPAHILASGTDLLDRVAHKVSTATKCPVDCNDILGVFWDIFEVITEGITVDDRSQDLFNISRIVDRSNKLASSGELRTSLTSQLVAEFINSTRVELDEEFPALSRAYLTSTAHRKVEVLKHYTFEATIFSTRLKVAEYRGYEVVSRIFDALAGDKGYLLMPDDTRDLYRKFEANASARMRVICDFVAGMTDRFALEFYGRLHSDRPQSIFKPI